MKTKHTFMAILISVGFIISLYPLIKAGWDSATQIDAFGHPFWKHSSEVYKICPHCEYRNADLDATSCKQCGNSLLPSNGDY